MTRSKQQEHEAAFRLRNDVCVRVVQDTTKVDGLGGEVWAGALVLCEFLETHDQEVVRERDVIELGAGCGLCGLVAASLGAKTTVLTDEFPDLLARNIAKNQHIWEEREADGSSAIVSSGELEWGVAESIVPFAHKFDTMLGTAAKQTGFTVHKHPSVRLATREAVTTLVGALGRPLHVDEDDWSVVFELRLERTDQ
ncbi:lysine methyltransferase METTL21E protein [Phytophthora nicotianae]|uniref:Lysine methyltransferase METTL21E protein n=1 Tax=Phytophthora nicotianae TaxID=4792 RepID=A0A0W8CLF5_PHYNI|nr:lysine methyltransferase METTL21E protein [Phytophthora nicotianae]